MKKIFVILMVLVLVGCSTSIDGMIYLKDTHDILEVSEMSKLLDLLPGNLHMSNFSEEETRVSVNYKVPLSEDMETVSQYWEDKEVFKKIFVYNGGVLLSKNPELEEVLFFLETKSNIYSIYVIRDDIEKILLGDEIKLSSDKELNNFLKVSSDQELVDAYYDEHSFLRFDRDEDC